MLLWFVKSYERNLKKLQFTTQRFDTNDTIALDNSKIITTNRRYHQSRLEAWHINSDHAPLNRDDGGYCQMLTCTSLIDDFTTQSRA